MEFRQIEAFVNAVKYKSFSRAADATFLTQPTISAHIGNLENELGVVLLNRNGREISLTKQGEAFFPYAVDMLNTRAQALFSVQDHSGILEGVLDIHTSTIPGQYFLPKLMAGFHEKHPGVKYFVEQSDSKNVIESILSQRGEIGFTGYQAGSGLICEPLFSDEVVLIAPARGKFGEWENGSEISFEDICREPFIFREEGSGTQQEIEKAKLEGSGTAVFKNVEVVARMNSLEAIWQAVAGGLGVSVVSRIVVENNMMNGSIRYFRIKGLKKQRMFYMVYNKNICLSPAGEAFCAMALELRDPELNGQTGGKYR